jgi:hypothetical protein
MGKTDDLRRLREAQHAQRESAIRTASGARAAAAPPPAPAPSLAEAIEDAVVPTAKPKAAVSGRAARVARAAAADDTGTCSSCHKAKPLQNGVIASHQKGLGKMCPGSRKPPA